MHSSVMQPSLATNLETETSPGLLSALLGIYMDSHIDDSPLIPEARGAANSWAGPAGPGG